MEGRRGSKRSQIVSSGGFGLNEGPYGIFETSDSDKQFISIPEEDNRFFLRFSNKIA